MIDDIKKVENNSLIIILDLDKYIVYYNDIYILYYFFNYKYFVNKKGKYLTNSLKYLNRVIKILNEYKINYLVLEKRNNYNTLMNKKFDDNFYKYYIKKGKTKYKRKKIINNMYKSLKKIDNVRILKIIEECNL